jgi:hypothetical protein
MQERGDVGKGGGRRREGKHIYTHMHVYTHTCIYTHMHAYIYTHMHI